MFFPERLCPESFLLAEGVQWNSTRKSWLWVDIDGHLLCEYRNGACQQIQMDERIAFIVPVEDDVVLTGVKDKLVQVDLSSFEKKIVLSLDFPENLRFNDAKCDLSGRLWAGVMAMDRTIPGAVGSGSLLLIEDNIIQQTYSGMSIPNGMAWSADGRYYYHTDTPTHLICVYDVLEDGSIANKRIAVDLCNQDGAPDGFCIDDEGMLWVAMWDAACVLRCNPHNGKILEKIVLPEHRVSCCAFGGESGNTLVITTAADEERSEVGHVYICEDMPVGGVATNRYRLSQN